MKRLLILLAVLALLPAAASAGPIYGEAWRVPGGDTSFAAFGGGLNGPWTPNVPPGAADVTFEASAFNFANPAGADTLLDFLNSGNATNIVGSSAILSGQAISSDHTIADPWATFFRFTGPAFFEQGTTYHITHDDGFYLTAGGQIVDFMRPVAPTSDSFVWNGATGVYNYTILFGEWNGNPAVFEAPDFQPVPEPASMLLLGTGLFGLAGAARRRMKR